MGSSKLYVGRPRKVVIVRETVRERRARIIAECSAIRPDPTGLNIRAIQKVSPLYGLDSESIRLARGKIPF